MRYPAQGEWTEAEYLALDVENWMVELSDGCLKFLPMPNALHQDILLYIYALLNTFVTASNLGKVYLAPMPVRLWPEKFREPDIMFFKPGRFVDRRKPPNGVDLAMEIVNPGADSRKRDFEKKRADYAAAKVPEYWIVDPELNQITVLCLDGESYRVHGVFGAGAKAGSVLLSGYAVDVDAVFAAGTEGNSGKHS